MIGSGGIQMKTKKEIKHLDKLDRELNVGDYIATHSRSSLEIFVVVKQTPKMVTLGYVNGRRWNERKYPQDCVRLEHTPDLLMWVMKNKGGLI
jgi:hypothetical protein